MITCAPSALIDFAVPKWEAEPSVRIEDAYKWLYQATRGGEHLVISREKAADSLEKEWGSVGTALESERMWEPLSPDEKVGRFNIRPFKYSGGRIGDLVEAFLASSVAFRPETDGFVNAWNELGERLMIRSASLTHSEWFRLNAATKAGNYPAIHHSETYREGRHPAYRILCASEVQRLVDALV